MGTITKSTDDGSVLLLVSSLMENTGAHGIPNIKRAGTPLRRIIWATLFVVSLTLFTIQSRQLIITYINFDVDVNFEIAYQNEVDFPAVTICNMNPIRLSFLLEDEDLRLLFYGENNDEEEQNEREGGVNTSTPTTTNNASRTKPGGYSDWDDTDYTSESNCYSQILLARDIVADMPYSRRHDTGHFLRDMLLSCSYSGYPCSPANFTQFYNYRYGNCYTFIGRNSSYEQLKVTKAGPLYGLSLELFIEQHEYVGDIQPSAGIRILVHPHNVMPFPEDNGVSVSPGQETSIGIKRIKVSHIPHPYSECIPVDNIKSDNVFLRQFPGIIYNKDTCEKSCLYHELLSRCNCSEPRYRYNISDGDICWSNNDFENECIEDIENQYVNGDLRNVNSICNSPCTETSYEPTVSASVWPNQYHRDTVVETMLKTDTLSHLYEDSDYDSFIQNNFAKVLVFFNELNYDNIYDTEKYLWYDLLSDLGGQFGLWIGVSVLTVFEFVELMYDIFLILLYKSRDVCISRKRANKQVVDETRQTPVFAFEATNDVIM